MCVYACMPMARLEIITIAGFILVLVLVFPALLLGLSPDGQALLDLKRSITDPYGHLGDWDPRDRLPCAWTGVICNSSGSVTGLDLSLLNLTGSFAARFGAGLDDTAGLGLAGLRSLNICCNGFSTPLPPAVTRFPSLTSLDVSRNFFVGDFPSDFLSNSLLYLTAFSNNFSGGLPLGIAGLTNLVHLDLGGSFFSGEIPPEYGRLSNLEYLGLSGNLLSGPIPPEIGNLTRLRHMVIGYNKYSGGIPASFGNLTQLNYLDLCCTNLSDGIPPELGRLAELNTLFLYRNSLTGSLPPEMGNMTSLMSLDLSVNNLTGPIPSEFSRLSNLTLLSLMYNGFNGSLPEGIGRLPNLLTLLIWNNSFSGDLPQQLGRSSMLEWVDVSSNNFVGPIPPDLCLHKNITKLIMFSNRLTGPVPSSLAECPSLLRVRIHDNELTGPIPGGFGKLPKLTRLELQRNHLTGGIPPDISNASKLSYLDFSFNALEGSLPRDIWRLPNIQSFYAAGNALMGSIPEDIATCALLTVLDLSSNNLSGEVPSGLGRCQSLVTIRLDQNKLTGVIPPELAGMPDLEVIDLSQNGLTGIIPIQFQNSTALEIFNVSYNNLSGPVPLEGMFHTASPTSFVGNPGLCGGVLQPCSGAGFDSFYYRMKARSSGSVVLIVVGILVLSLIALVGGGRCLYTRYYLRRSWRHEDMDEDPEEWPWRMTAFQRLPFTTSDILDCLKDANMVGRGATGTVYRAAMPSGDIVAVKKLWTNPGKDLLAAGGIRSGGRAKPVRGKGGDPCGTFQAEVDLLGSIRHRNIVRLLGYCTNNVITLLIYEYMPNGSLEDALHSKEKKINVLADWVTRYNVAMGIAQGLCYLHHDCFPLVLHRDVKSNNILLDSNMETRVADFGLAKLVETKESMSIIAGSYGYIAPEYAYTLKVDEKTDIYSFGVVLLELLTGRRPIEAEFGDSVNIVEWVRLKIQTKAGLKEALDADVGATCRSVQEEMLLVLRIALLCTSGSPRERPSMRDVVTMLEEAKPRRKGPSKS